MSRLDLFFAAGLADQIAVAGTPCAIKNPGGGVPVPFTGVLTEQSGALETEVGLMTATTTAHLLLPLSAGITPHPSAVVSANGKKYTVVSVTRSPSEAAFSCDLQSLTPS